MTSEWSEANPTPPFIEVSPASQGKIEIRVTLDLPGFSEQCREAALWFLTAQDRFKDLLR